MSGVVIIFCFLIQCFHVLAFSHVALLSNTLIAKDAGRYTQVKIGINDSLPFMAFNDEKKGGVGVAHCTDPLCNHIQMGIVDRTGSPNSARFIFMRMNPATTFAQMTYADQSSDSSLWSIKFLSCLDLLCTNYNLTYLYNSTTKENLPSYSSFTYGGANGRWHFPVVTFCTNGTNGTKERKNGLFMIWCANVHCTSHDDPRHIAEGKIGYPSIELSFGTTGYKAGVPIFVYYDEDSGTLNYTICYEPDCQSMSTGVVDSIKGNKVGKYNFMRLCSPQSIMGTPLCTMYVNEDTGDLRYAVMTLNYNPFSFTSQTTIIGNIGNTPYGVFPELDFYSGLNNFQPVLSFFDTVSNISGSLKFAQCSDKNCKTTQIDTLVSGSAGYGRDSSIAWLESHKLMYISFLDFNGGEQKRARLLVLNVTADEYISI